ncbi:TPA: hypothetical protein ACIVQM_004692, partial [Salmonella enterica subsp. enterica serovar Chester]
YSQHCNADIYTTAVQLSQGAVISPATVVKTDGKHIRVNISQIPVGTVDTLSAQCPVPPASGLSRNAALRIRHVIPKYGLMIGSEPVEILASSTHHSSNYGFITDYFTSFSWGAENCFSVGVFTYPSTSVYWPATVVDAQIPDSIKPGHYEGKLLFRAGLGISLFTPPLTGQQADLPEFTQILSSAGEVAIPFPVEVKNSCKFTNSDITLDHGSITYTEAIDNIASATTSLVCEYSAGIAKVEIKSAGANFVKATDGIDIPLSNGWISTLSVEGPLGQHGSSIEIDTSNSPNLMLRFTS